MTDKLWIVGKISQDGGDWEFCGVFNEKELALKFCSSENHFLGRAILNEILPDEPQLWYDSYYPKLLNNYSKEDQIKFNEL